MCSLFNPTKIASVGNYCRDSICFAVLAWGLIKQIEPTPKVSVQVEIICDFSRIFNKLLVFLDGWRIIACIRLHLVSTKLHMIVFWTLLKKNTYTYITYLCRNMNLGGCTYLPIFTHKKLNFDKILQAVRYALGWWNFLIVFFSSIHIFFTLDTIEINKKFLTAHSTIYIHICMYIYIGARQNNWNTTIFSTLS